ncbi:MULTISPECIES: glycosyltransferase family protein [Sanguibacteroides]|uniref:glycosyltransferase family protein n=1 Tax=Sanguibacteroides TaxID=1635148 RepID=UPI000698422E|nr:MULTISPECIES: glycosyltransferase family protein [Sanguibacteroides]PXZ42858.1 glycosyltransferase [Sanguibacteroides justesenii]
MRFVFIIQGEGRGHFTQALVMREMLTRRGDEVIEVLIGKSEARQVPDFFLQKIDVPVLTFESPNFLPSVQNKRPSLSKSIYFNIGRLPVFVKSMRLIHRRLEKLQPDMVLNFYELLTGLVYLFTPPDIPLVCIGHQYMFLHDDYVFPRISRLELASLRFFTRLTSVRAVRKLALSFYSFPPAPRARVTVVPPLLRKEVLQYKPVKGEYIHGYMLNSGYVLDIIAWHRIHPEIALHFFWDEKSAPETWVVMPGFTLHRINDMQFLHCMNGCKAYATTAGFESLCEALYLHKPVLMVPVHVEQKCNAYEAVRVGAGVEASEFDMDRLLQFLPSYRVNPIFRAWADSAEKRVVKEIDEACARRKSSLYERLYCRIADVLLSRQSCILF